MGCMVVKNKLHLAAFPFTSNTVNLQGLGLALQGLGIAFLLLACKKVISLVI